MTEHAHPPLASIDDVQEQRLTDKSEWPRGPWDDEPDRMEWRDTDGVPVLPCLIVRNGSGALCGYVGVPIGHPWHGKNCDEVRQADGDWPDAHGGLTYGDACQPGGHICHTPLPGESDDTWWLGFDCAHSGDVIPRYDRTGRFGRYGDEYKTVGYVRGEVAKLAQQAREAAK